MKTPYEEGIEAYEKDLSPEESPYYKVNDENQKEWMMGWYAADRAWVEYVQWQTARENECDF